MESKTPTELAMELEAKITNAIRTSKHTANFRVYLDIMQVAYKQATVLSDLLKAADKISENK